VIERGGNVPTESSGTIQVGGFTVGAGLPVLVVAEIGNNHNGSVERAKQLVDAAAEAGADCAKFQLRSMATLYRNQGLPEAHGEDLGAQYTLDLLARFSLPKEELVEVFDYASKLGLLPLCTPWDVESAHALHAYGMAAFKVASADLTNHELLGELAATGRPLLVSTGMSDEHEVAEAVRFLEQHRVPYALLHANSTYPTPFKDVNLRYLARLRTLGSGPVGYSGHERGWHVALAAVALGASVIEKHITLDRDLEGNDHQVSLLPGEFRQMVRAIRELEAALGSDAPRRITQGELLNRVTLAKSLVATCDIEPGVAVGPEMVAVKSPGRGLQPNRRGELLGRVMRRRVAAGDFFYPSDLEGHTAAARAYRFRRPWGLPVRYHDALALRAASNPDFLEFHLSYKDLNLDPEEYLPEPLDLGLVVHAPDLFAGDHILNLAAADESYRQRSLAELQRVIDTARRLAPRFARTTTPLVVVSLGGFSREGPLPPAARPELYARVAGSLAQLDSAGVELIAQTLAPFPWYLGGQLWCNLFVDPADTAEFAATYGVRLCLDVSHSRMAANHCRVPFEVAAERLAPHAAHLHLADARGVDGEGLQIGDGEIDWGLLAGQLQRLAPAAGFIPEIWQGHRNQGEDFWIACERLEQWF
jgi:N-acetylneuraminate synthase